MKPKKSMNSAIAYYAFTLFGAVSVLLCTLGAIDTTNALSTFERILLAFFGIVIGGVSAHLAKQCR